MIILYTDFHYLTRTFLSKRLAELYLLTLIVKRLNAHSKGMSRTPLNLAVTIFEGKPKCHVLPSFSWFGFELLCEVVEYVAVVFCTCLWLT